MILFRSATARARIVDGPMDRLLCASSEAITLLDLMATLCADGKDGGTDLNPCLVVWCELCPMLEAVLDCARVIAREVLRMDGTAFLMPDSSCTLFREVGRVDFAGSEVEPLATQGS